MVTAFSFCIILAVFYKCPDFEVIRSNLLGSICIKLFVSVSPCNLGTPAYVPNIWFRACFLTLLIMNVDHCQNPLFQE